jgi:hypothetical protein
MISIVFKQPRTTAWKRWRRKLKAAQSALNASHVIGTPLAVNDALYRAQKDAYFSLNGPFHGKCAYCETLIVANHPGDVEHFRPKGRIVENRTRVMAKDAAGNDVPHPGYYWLAYDYKNLLPACEDCNRPNKARSGGVLVGKWDSFPVRSFRAIKPGDETLEEPLLINPTDATQRVETHLLISKTGVVQNVSDRGKACSDVFGLNLREALVKERLASYWRGHDAVTSYLMAVINHNKSSADIHLQTIEDYERGAAPYSAAGRLGLADNFNTINAGPLKVTLNLATSNPA